MKIKVENLLKVLKLINKRCPDDCIKPRIKKTTACSHFDGNCDLCWTLYMNTLSPGTELEFDIEVDEIEVI